MSKEMNTITATPTSSKAEHKAAFFVKSGSPKTAKETIKMVLNFWFNLFG